MQWLEPRKYSKKRFKDFLCKHLSRISLNTQHFWNILEHFQDPAGVKKCFEASLQIVLCVLCILYELYCVYCVYCINHIFVKTALSSQLKIMNFRRDRWKPQKHDAQQQNKYILHSLPPAYKLRIPPYVICFGLYETLGGLWNLIQFIFLVNTEWFKTSPPTNIYKEKIH